MSVSKMSSGRTCPSCGTEIPGFRGHVVGSTVREWIRKHNQDIRDCPNRTCFGDMIPTSSIMRWWKSWRSKEWKEVLEEKKMEYEECDANIEVVCDISGR